VQDILISSKIEVTFVYHLTTIFVYIRHIIYAPAKSNKYGATGFPAISDAIASGNQTEIDQQIAIAVYFIRGALSTLKQFDKFIS
jgi:hypothetical protein